MDKILEMLAKIDEKRTKLAEINALSEKEDRDLTEVEDKEYTDGMTEIKSLRQRIERHVELNGLQDEFEELKAGKASGARDPNQGAADEKKWRDTGEFYEAVIKADRGGVVDKRLVEARAASGMNTGVPEEGGYLVQTEHATELLKKTYETGVLASRVRKWPIGPNANGLTMNYVKDSNRSTGSRWGGLQSYWIEEAGEKEKSKPGFDQLTWRLKKMVGLAYLTDEQLQDSTGLAAFLTDLFSEDFSWMIDDAVLRGNGVGKPRGIIDHPATIEYARDTANEIHYEDIVGMWARMWGRSRGNSIWTINQECEPELLTLNMVIGTSGFPIYMPPGGASAAPYGNLLGRPVIPIEHASALGTKGDLALMDLNQYLAIEKGGIQTASSIHVRFVNDETAFRYVYRIDGQPLWPDALTPANGTNTLSPFVILADTAG